MGQLIHLFVGEGDAAFGPVGFLVHAAIAVADAVDADVAAQRGVLRRYVAAV